MAAAEQAAGADGTPPHFSLELLVPPDAPTPAANRVAAAVAEGHAQWLHSFWCSKQRKHGVRISRVGRSGLRVQADAPCGSSAEFEAHWSKQIVGALKKVEVEDLGDMAAPALWESIPEVDGSGRGRQDLATIERELSVKVVFCEDDGHVLLVGAKAKLEKKCFVVRNLLSHYHWRLSGRDVAFETMTART